MTLKEMSFLIKQELDPVYPATEIEGVIFLIFNHLFGFKKFEIYQKYDVKISDLHASQIYNIIEQLKQHTPIQYILGETEFYSLPFFVDSSVLIPRPETEELVHWIVQDYLRESPRMIDIGTGSGCIAIALAKNLPDAFVIGMDISGEALATAAKNAERNDTNVHFMKFDFLSDDKPDLGIFDVIVSNPPYVTHEQKAEMQPNVLGFEPHLALFAPQHDPLIFYKAIGNFALKSLRNGGRIYLEINETMAEETVSVFLELGFVAEIRKDINNKYRMIRIKKRS